jgi:hypothetical protein
METSLVTAGANQHADVLLFKRANDAFQHKEVGMADKTELDKLVADLARADAEVSKLEGVAEELRKQVNAKQAEIDVRDRDIVALKAKLDVEVAKNADPEEELLKSMSPAAKSAYLAQKALNDKLTKRLAEEDDRRELNKIAKAFEADYPALPVKGDDIAPVIKAIMTATDADGMAVLNKALKAGSDALTFLSKVEGATRAGGPVTSAEQEVEKKAREMAAADKISYESAYAKVLQADPALYERITGAAGGRQ